jgi:hypothetical protein
VDCTPRVKQLRSSRPNCSASAARSCRTCHRVRLSGTSGSGRPKTSLLLPIPVLSTCSTACACRLRGTHSITSSARAINVGGTVSPRDLAVLRLSTSSNSVGCSIGSSAGLAPIELGVCRPAVVATASSEKPLVAGFKAWLRKHRGASDATIKLYARDADLVMTALAADSASWCPAGLDGAVPAYAHWRLADMPRYLTAEQVKRLIAACDGEFHLTRSPHPNSAN